MSSSSRLVSLQQGGHDGSVSVQPRRQVRHGHAWAHGLAVLPAETVRYVKDWREGGQRARHGHYVYLVRSDLRHLTLTTDFPA